ncbi:MAG: DUF2141 domain-containing protein [Myxococcota bacterium]
MVVRAIAVLAVLFASAEAHAATVTIDVIVESDEGRVVCVLFGSADGFPMKQQKAKARSTATPKSKKAVCTFKDVPAGGYAAIAFHDRNKNRELDTNWVGMPKEPVGASNGAKGTMGPPSFEDARFSVSDAGAKQTIRLR